MDRRNPPLATRQVFDVVIVGAGPAGAYLAGGLAREGLGVALVDRSPFPREKVCGGGLSQKTLALLPERVRRTCAQDVRGAIVAFANTRHLEKRMEAAEGATVLRSEFDHALVEYAKTHGAQFFSDAPFAAAERLSGKWHCQAGTYQLTAPILVGADGVFSQVRSRLFARDLVQYTAAVEAYFYFDQGVIERFQRRLLFDFGGMPHGYGWIFPKEDHLNVGVYSIFRSRSIRESFNQFCRLYPFLQTATRVKQLGHAIPVRNTRHQYERDSCLLVGDAGGFAEAFYGEGIYFALKSADCARRAILESAGHCRPGCYTSLIQKELEQELRQSLRNARLFFQYPRLAYRLLAENAMTSDWFGAMIHGGLSHRDVFWRTVTTLPYWLAFGGRTDRLPGAHWLTSPRQDDRPAAL